MATENGVPPVRGEQETGKKRCVGCGLWNECDECPSAVSIGKVKSQHGKDCPKVQHLGGGYLHDPDDDGIYDVDGVTYCGRCHGWMGSAPVRAEAAKTEQPDMMQALRKGLENMYPDLAAASPVREAEPKPATCETHGHLYGVADACIMCGSSLPPVRGEQETGKSACQFGVYCRKHGFIHGAEASELRELLKDLQDSRVDAILDDVDARDSLAYVEVLVEEAAEAFAAEEPLTPEEEALIDKSWNIYKNGPAQPLVDAIVCAVSDPDPAHWPAIRRQLTDAVNAAMRLK